MVIPADYILGVLAGYHRTVIGESGGTPITGTINPGIETTLFTIGVAGPLSSRSLVISGMSAGNQVPEDQERSLEFMGKRMGKAC